MPAASASPCPFCWHAGPTGLNNGGLGRRVFRRGLDQRRIHLTEGALATVRAVLATKRYRIACRDLNFSGRLGRIHKMKSIANIRELILNALPSSWKATTSGGADGLILTTPEGHIATVVVRETIGPLFRIHLNQFKLRRRGSQNSVTASRQLAPRVEITVCRTELPQYALWCANWIVAMSSTSPLPAPTQLADGDPANIWSLAARTEYASWKNHGSQSRAQAVGRAMLR